jgi:membrane-bound lytic murein transglycosylase D
MSVIAVLIPDVNAGIQQPADSLKTKIVDSLNRITINTDVLVVNGLPNDMPGAPAVQLNKNAIKYVRDFINKNARTLDQIQDKHPNTFAVIDEIFTKYNLPLELKYLAVIESELKTTARSRVGARGVWQLMPQTARDYKLKVTGTYDERAHLYKSTVAAAKYLNYLHDLMGDWLLVIAAYNGGPGTVYKAIKKSGSRDFWKLQSFLPAETRSHVKRFIGTHYYYEGAGSVTTLTKAEADLHARKMSMFFAKQAMQMNEKPVEKTLVEEPATAANNGVPATVSKPIGVGEMRVDEEE